MRFRSRGVTTAQKHRPEVTAEVERRKLAQAEADKERGSSAHTTSVAARFEESLWRDTHA